MLDDYYGLTEPAATDSFLTGAGVAAIVLVVIIGILVLAAIVLILISNCKIFKKAGEAWWKGLIPLYNSWVETRITGLGWWWFIIFVVITALFSRNTDESNFVLYMSLILTSFNYNYNLAKKFGKTNGFAVFNTIFPVIGLPILAFGSAKYDAEAKVDENGIFSIKK